jgi:hypothetical protein
VAAVRDGNSAGSTAMVLLMGALAYLAIARPRLRRT